MKTFLFYKNARALYHSAECLLREMEGQSYPFGSKPILECIEQQIKSDLKDIRTYKPGFDYNYSATVMIENISYDLVGSGKYHIYTGTLNPLGPGRAIRRIHNRILDHAVAKEYLPADEAEEIRDQLSKQIRWVG